MHLCRPFALGVSPLYLLSLVLLVLYSLPKAWAAPTEATFPLDLQNSSTVALNALDNPRSESNEAGSLQRRGWLDWFKSEDRGLAPETSQKASAYAQGHRIDGSLEKNAVYKYESVEECGTRYVTTTKKLGSGGWGDVYEGLVNAEPVAVKVLTVTSDNMKLRALEGADVQFELGEAVVGVKDYFWDNTDDTAILVMDYMKGGDMTGVGEMDAGQQYCLSLARAVEVMHGAGVAHRDIKPANMMRSDEQSSDVKLMDFDFATKRKNEDREAYSGSEGYVSPEAGHAVHGYDTKKSDMFSVGITEMHFLGLLDGSDTRFWYSLVENKEGVTREEAHRKIKNKGQAPLRKKKLSNEWVDLLSKVLCGAEWRADIKEHLDDLKGAIKTSTRRNVDL